MYAISLWQPFASLIAEGIKVGDTQLVPTALVDWSADSYPRCQTPTDKGVFERLTGSNP